MTELNNKVLPENEIIDKAKALELFGTENQKVNYAKTNKLKADTKKSLERTLEQYYESFEEVKHPTVPRAKAYKLGALRNEVAERNHQQGKSVKQKLFKTQNEFREHIKECYEGYVVADDSDIYRNTHNTLKLIHLECGRTFETNFSNFSRGRSRSCGCRASKGERRVIEYLFENEIEHEKEYTFDDLLSDKNRHLRFDFAIKSNGKLLGLIEVDGKQHKEQVTWSKGENAEENLLKVINTDKKKNEYALNNNIPIIRISHEHIDMTEDIVKDFIENIETRDISYYKEKIDLKEKELDVIVKNYKKEKRQPKKKKITLAVSTINELEKLAKEQNLLVEELILKLIYKETGEI